MDQLKEGPIQPMRLGPDSRFGFRCHKDVKCFTQCCRGNNIILTPYDIIRLKKRLGLSSEEFLAVYTEPQMLEKTDIPVVVKQSLARRPSPSSWRVPCYSRPKSVPNNPTCVRCARQFWQRRSPAAIPRMKSSNST